jgi:hypothetical protein
MLGERSWAVLASAIAVRVVSTAIVESIQGCTSWLPETEVTRIEWSYLDSQADTHHRGREIFMAVPAYRTRSGLVRARVDAKLAWGVDLHTGQGRRVHESVADKDLIEPFAGRPDLEDVVAVEQHGRNFDGDLLVVSRTVTWMGDGLSEIPAACAGPPTEAEASAVHAALDYLGYTGPREIRLLLAVTCT